MKRYISSKRLILATLCAATLMGSTAFAANPHHGLRERGTIQSIDMKDNQLTVKDAHSGAMQVFIWDQDTKFLEREHWLGKAKTIMPADLKTGEKALIRYEKENDQFVARQVLITGEPHAAAKATQQNPS